MGTVRWSTSQLVEFLAAVTSPSDTDSVLSTALERIAEAVEAEIAVVYVDDAPIAHIGFPAGIEPSAGLMHAADQRGILEIAPLGECVTMSIPLDEPIQGTLFLSRVGTEPFSGEERSLLRGMARILALSIRNQQV